jgi:hypothetical protein
MSSGTTSFSEILSQKGDLLFHDGNGLNRFPVGADNTILVSQTTSTSGFAWETPQSGQYVKIASSVLTADATSIEITSISQGYQTLRVVALIRGSGTTSQVARLYINSNAATIGFSTTSSESNLANSSGATSIGLVQISSNTLNPESTYAYNDLIINQYSDTSRYKVVEYFCIRPSYHTTSTSYGFNNGINGGGQLQSTTAVSQVKIVSGSTNFASGSSLHIYAYSLSETYTLG